MLKELKNTANLTYTENGAATNLTSFSDCVDLFGTIGALRHADDEEIIRRFVRAYTENADLAMKTLFYARDIRGGLGERRVFRTILLWLARNEKQSVLKNLGYIAEYGRWDDVLALFDTPCRAAAVELIKAQLDADVEAMREGKSVSLLGKWLPSANTSNAKTVYLAKRLIKELGMTEPQYRKTLSALRKYIKIIENDLRERDYTFDYSAQPSKAMLKYRKAFVRNDGERYSAFLNKVSSGEAKLHTDTLMPYEIVQPFVATWNNGSFFQPAAEAETDALNATWSALRDYTDGSNSLAVIDTSGSMYWNSDPMPAAVALSLGLYFAERSKGAFANHFIEFSEKPRLIEIKGDTFYKKLRYVHSFSQVANTNIEAVFDLILKAAVDNHVPQSELPERIYLISDMEFDMAARGADITNFENAKRKYAAYGYMLPQIVFWNVCSRNTQMPVTVNDRGVALVSGCTPKIFSMVMKGEFSPYDFMMEVLGSDRYKPIAA